MGKRWIYVENNSNAKVRGIGSCKVKFCGGLTLLLHDVLYNPDIQWYLVSVVVLLKLGFSSNFHGSSLSFYSGFKSENFMILYTEFGYGT